MLEGYEKLPNGVIKQKEIFNKIQTYDDSYIELYEGFGEIGTRMSYIRLANIISSLWYKPLNILDVGYGNGDFLKLARDSNIISYGSDISGYPTPDGVKFVEWKDVFDKFFDVITFFDCLEHFEDINFVKNLNCYYVVISLPECHYFSDEWFENWKHRKPDEHLYHFNKSSLIDFMKEMGYSLRSVNNVEDLIRKPVDHSSNILTGVFIKNYV